MPSIFDIFRIPPTIRYRDESTGYSFNEASPEWQEYCRQFPCFLALQWPGYTTGIIEDTINGQAVVIQWWKGRCQKFLGGFGVGGTFPGGIGGEVGIYRRIPGKAIPPLPFFLRGFTDIANRDLWWPFPELGAEIEFTLTNPNNGQKLLAAGPHRSYWSTKWMDEGNAIDSLLGRDSYSKYRKAQGAAGTPKVEDYVLQFKINGVEYNIHGRVNETPPGTETPPGRQQDCLPYDVNALRIENIGDRGWVLTDGQSRMLLLDNQQDAEAALALAKRHTLHCFIGRNNQRSNRKDYIVEYWSGSSGLSTVIPNPDCITYDPSHLQIQAQGSEGWLLTDGQSRILLLDNQQDAQSALEMAQHHTKQCFIGRSNQRLDRKNYIVQYWD